MRTSNTQRSHIQQGGSIAQSAGATPNSQQSRANTSGQVARQSPPVTSVAGTSFTGDGFRRSTGDQRGNVGGTAQSVSRPDDLINLQSEQNWRPTARMRGSLSGRQYSDDVRQRIITPTQGTKPAQISRQHPQVQGSRPQGQQPVQSPRPQGQQPVQGPRPQGQQSVQGSRLQGPQPLQRPPFLPTSVSPQLDVLIANNRNARNHSKNT